MLINYNEYPLNNNNYRIQNDLKFVCSLRKGNQKYKNLTILVTIIDYEKI